MSPDSVNRYLKTRHLRRGPSQTARGSQRYAIQCEGLLPAPTGAATVPTMGTEPAGPRDGA